MPIDGPLTSRNKALRVLSVEDNPATRVFVRLALEAEGYEVAEAATALDGLRLAERVHPHVVLVDLLLPDMGGLELAERIRRLAEPRRLAIIAFTGAIPEEEAAALRSGVLDDLLLKPADPLELVRVVARHLPSPTGLPGKGRRILAVGVDASEGVRLRLEALGSTVLTVSGGHEALDAARAAPPHLVVSETTTSGLSGFELCAALRHDPALSSVPVVLVSTFGADDNDQRSALRVGASALVGYRADLRGLEQAVRHALEDPSPRPLPEPPHDPRDEYIAYLQRRLRHYHQRGADQAAATSMRVAQLELVDHLAAELASGADLDLALSTLVAELVHVLGASRGVVYVADFDGRPVPRAQLGYPRGEISEGFGHRALMEQAEAVTRTLVVGQTDGGQAAAALEANTARSLAATPITMGGHRLGTIVVASQRADLAAWAPFLDAVGTHVALAVRLAHTFERLAGSEQVVDHRVRHDALTGLPNELFVLERLASGVVQTQPGATVGALLLVGIDRFRYHNASFGHHHGNLVLQSLASRLSDRLGPELTVGRPGGDRFVVLVPLAQTRGRDALDLANELLDWLAEPLTCEGVEHRLTASAGVVLFPAHGVDPPTLLWRAETAMRQAKDTGGGAAVLFDPGWGAEASHWLLIDQELRAALSGKGGLRLHYQPRVSIPFLRVVGAEALLRWDHPELGHLSPGVIIAVAEESGLIVELGRWVLDAACAQIRAWMSAAAPAPPRVAVNVAAHQLFTDSLPGDVAEALRRWELPGSALELEITETAAMHNLERTAVLLSDVRALGVTVVLDDLGTGYSSLAYLRRLPLDAIKIDQSFIRELSRDESNQAIVATIVDLAHRLEFAAVAEGVETQAQLDHLIRCDCDGAQGWLFAPALPAEEFRKFFVASEGSRARVP